MCRDSQKAYVVASCPHALLLLLAPFVWIPHVSFNSDKIQEEMSLLTIVLVTSTSNMPSGPSAQLQNALYEIGGARIRGSLNTHLLPHRSAYSAVPRDYITEGGRTYPW